MCEYRDELAKVGVSTTSRWLNNHGQGERDADTNGSAVYETGDLVRFANEDIEDIRAADVFVTFTERRTAGYTSGGRHVEFGLAFAAEKRIMIVGPLENVFHELAGSHPLIEQVPDWDAAKMVLFRIAMSKLQERDELVRETVA